MRAHALFLLGLIALCPVIAADLRDIGLRETELKKTRTDLVEIKNELTNVKRQQKANQSAEKQAHLAKVRQELEATVGIVELSIAETNATITELRSRLSTAKPCPLCGGKLAKIRSLPSNKKQARKNTVVWGDPDDSLVLMCGNDAFAMAGPVCTRCWSSPSFNTREWKRSTRDRSSFVIPLVPAVSQLPQPPDAAGTLRYWQEFAPNGTRTDGVSYVEAKPSPEYVDSVVKYAAAHGLEFRRTAIGWYAGIATRHNYQLPAPPLPPSDHPPLP
jgi:hypothetical protein